MQAYFDTLNAALSAENLLHTWDSRINKPIEYGETYRYTFEGRSISIYRNNEGRYERPVHYPM